MKIIYKKSNDENENNFIETFKKIFDRICISKKEQIRKLIKNTIKCFKE